MMICCAGHATPISENAGTNFVDKLHSRSVGIVLSRTKAIGFWFWFFFVYVLYHGYIYQLLAYFPGVARLFIYPNLIVICVLSMAEIAHLGGIFSIITSKFLGDTLRARRLMYILLHLLPNYSVEYPTVNSFTFHVTR
jgi:hypothetical protein